MMSDLKATILQHDRMTPRYTSYPSANHFTDSCKADVFMHGLKSIPAQTEISLYLHIPFCKSLCHYCGCLTFATQRQDRVDDYLKLLLAEARLVAADLPAGITLGHLHLGGGSPTILPTIAFNEFMNDLRQIIPFSSKIDIALEADPRQLTEEKIADYAAAGINRISFGVQDFDQTVMSSVNRTQPAYMTQQAVAWCRQYGINNINFDLMYGLPHQTVTSMEKTFSSVVDIKPSRIAFFGYAHVPWMKNHMAAIDMAKLPDASLRYDLFDAGSKILENAGYKPIGIDHFVQSDDSLYTALNAHSVHRNFQGYTTDTSRYLIGLGASAISKLPTGFSQNTADLSIYKEMVESGILPVKRGWKLSKADAMHSAIIEDIMCYLSVDLSAYINNYKLPESYFATAVNDLKPLIEQNIIHYHNHKLTIAPECRMLTRLVAFAFDQYADRTSSNQQRHARTV